MSVIRYSQVKNTTGAALLSALVTDGQDYKFQMLERVIATEDIGSNPGQITNGSGCLMAQFKGAKIIDVYTRVFSLKQLNSGEMYWIPIDTWDGKNSNNPGVRWVNGTDGVSSIYLSAPSSPSMAAGDSVQLFVVLGNA